MALGQWKVENPTEEWKRVQRKRLRNRIVGKMCVDKSYNAFKVLVPKSDLDIL